MLSFAEKQKTAFPPKSRKAASFCFEIPLGNCFGNEIIVTAGAGDIVLKIVFRRRAFTTRQLLNGKINRCCRTGNRRDNRKNLQNFFSKLSFFVHLRIKIWAFRMSKIITASVRKVNEINLNFCRRSFGIYRQSQERNRKPALPLRLAGLQRSLVLIWRHSAYKQERTFCGQHCSYGSGFWPLLGRSS